MMEWIRHWLLSIIGISVLIAAADGLMPAGGVKKVGQLVCGLVLLCVLIRPLAALRSVSVSEWLESYHDQIQSEETALELQAGQTRKAVIESYCGTYIVDKAAQLGLSCRAEVECSLSVDGLYLPCCARLWGDFDAVIQSRLTQLLEAELGIAPEYQTYYLTKEAEG